MCIFCDDGKVIEGLHKNTVDLHQLIELQKATQKDVENIKWYLNSMNKRFNNLLKEEHKMSIELTALEAAVANETTVDTSAIALIQGIAAKLAAAGTYVRRQKRIATAAWTSPEDYLNILINKSSGTEKFYTYPVRFNDNTNQLMIGDLPIIQHTVFNPGEGFVGDFARGARIFQRSDATMRFSTENASNFVNNVTTVLVEERIALADFFPESFVKVALNGASS